MRREKHKQGWFSNYCGLGGYGIPQHAVDEICKQHDDDYDHIQKQGKNPYLSFNWADEKMLNALRSVSPQSKREYILKHVSQNLWRAKWQFLSNDESLSKKTDSAQATIGPRTPESKKRVAPLISPVRKKMRRQDEDGDEQMEASSKGAPVHGGNKSKTESGLGAQETPLIYHSPSFGLPETHTAVLPMTIWFSVAGLDSTLDTNSTLTIRGTSPYDPVSTVPVSIGSRPATIAAGTKQIAVNPLSYAAGALSYPADANGTFPKTWAGTEIPAWRDYFARLYEVYAVLGMHYRATIRTACSDGGADLTVMTATEAYGATSSGQKIPETFNLAESYAWKGFKYYNINNFDNDQAGRKDTMVVTGSYKPGQNRTNVRNDEDVKTWTPMTNQPSLTENVKIFFAKSPLGVAPTTKVGCNVMLEIKYIVQFKDLKEQARWPQKDQTPFAQNLPTDIIQTW
ncbi:MAG: hypothetical protein L5655_11555 [Thermosediminibacteraceae bacterium]|nr:hypothetical protein [Thermosediminibacteraceae bacterium]